MAMEPRLSLLTLGVADVPRAREFYEELGFTASSAGNADVAFFPAGGAVLGLFGRDALARDADVPPGGSAGFSGVTLAHNVRTEAEVGAILEAAERAGGRIVKPAGRAFWGGWHGYFADLDGHLWEVAHNPHFPLDAEGRLQLPPADAAADKA